MCRSFASEPRPLSLVLSSSASCFSSRPVFRREGTTSRKRLLKRPTRVNMKQGKRKKKMCARLEMRRERSPQHAKSTLFALKTTNSPSVRAQASAWHWDLRAPETRPQLEVGGNQRHRISINNDGQGIISWTEVERRKSGCCATGGKEQTEEIKRMTIIPIYTNTHTHTLHR